MGTCHSKSDKIERDKNHNRQKMLKFGGSIGRNDLNFSKFKSLADGIQQ